MPAPNRGKRFYAALHETGFRLIKPVIICIGGWTLISSSLGAQYLPFTRPLGFLTLMPTIGAFLGDIFDSYRNNAPRITARNATVNLRSHFADRPKDGMLLGVVIGGSIGLTVATFQLTEMIVAPQKTANTEHSVNQTRQSPTSPNTANNTDTQPIFFENTEVRAGKYCPPIPMYYCPSR